jgi:hypothetical protein
MELDKISIFPKLARKIMEMIKKIFFITFVFCFTFNNK